jgi:hypothetical protein
MGRIRTIKPEFFKHSELFDAERESGLPLRIAFAGLWTCADKAGRFKWRPRELKIDVLPYDDVDFSRVLDALESRGFLVKYARRGEMFGYIPTWEAHQFINNKEPASSLPTPEENQQVNASATREPRVSDALSTRGVKEGKGREGNDACVTRPGADADAITPEMVASGVSSELGIGFKSLAAIVAVCKSSLAKGADPTALRNDMLGAWEDYKRSMPNLSWTYSSAEKFFAGNLWDAPKSWPWKTGKSPPKPAGSPKQKFIPAEEL